MTLARYTPIERRNTRRKSAAEPEEIQLSPAEQLLELLKGVRENIAKKEQVPPYIVLTDKALLEMVRTEPIDMESFSRVEGVGERKTVKYWKPFVTAIRKFKGIRDKLGTGMSQEETLLLLNAGYDVNAIAEAKGIKPITVYGHIADLISNDKLSDFSSVITREQYLRVMEVAKKNPDDFYTILAGEMPAGLPKVAVAISDFLLRKKCNS